MDNQKFATADGSSSSEILTPHFSRHDGSDMVLFENFFGYADNFRIGKTAHIDFKQYTDTQFNFMEIESSIINLKNINSSISNIVFKIKNIDKGIVRIFYKYGNRLSDIATNKWIQNRAISVKDDVLRIKDSPPRFKYYKWKMELARNPIEEDNPVFYYFNIRYEKNLPPLAPKNINKSIYNNMFKLAWDENREKDLKGYIVYWGKKSRMYENKIDIGNKNHYILDFLEKKGNYYFTVKAYDSKDPYNLSLFSKEVHIFNK